MMRDREGSELASSKTSRPAIIAFGTGEWSSSDWKGRHYCLATLAKRGWHVLYTSGALSVWDRETTRWAASGLLTHFETRDGLDTCQAGRIPPRWPRLRPWDSAVRRYHAHLLRAQLKKYNYRNIIFYATDPYSHHYYSFIDPDFLVYSIHDRYDLMPDWRNHNSKYHNEMIEKANMILCANRFMLDDRTLSCYESKIHELPHGVDLESFTMNGNVSEPEDLAEIPHPRVAYFGALNYKVDFSLIAHVAERRPNWHWVLVGPQGQSNDEIFSNDRAVEAQWRYCKSLPNVHFLGVKPRTQVGTYARFMDVLTMCYRQDGSGWWRCGQPLKLFEYMAVGKPIVSSDLAAVRSHADLVRIAPTPEAWIDALEHGINAPDPNLASTLRAVARNNSWEERVDRLETWLEAMIARH